MEVRELSERILQREDQLFLLLTLIIGAIVVFMIVKESSRSMTSCACTEYRMKPIAFKNTMPP